MHNVVISSTGESFQLPNDAHLSDAAELQLAGLTFGCRQGMCGICVIEVLDCMEHLSRPSPKEVDLLEFLGYDAGRNRLACQCRVRGDITIRQC